MNVARRLAYLASPGSHNGTASSTTATEDVKKTSQRLGKALCAKAMDGAARKPGYKASPVRWRGSGPMRTGRRELSVLQHVCRLVPALGILLR